MSGKATRCSRTHTTHYQNAVDTYPRHALALEGLGKLTYADYGPEPKAQRLEKSAKWPERALDLDPTLPDAPLYLARVSSRTPRPHARHSAGETFVMDPCQTVSMTNYAERLSDRGYGAEAEEIFQKVLNKMPSKDSRRDRVLRAYARMPLYRTSGKDEADIHKAVELLREAARSNPSDAPNHFYLGLAYSWLSGHESEATQHVKEALLLRPEFEAAGELLLELEEDGTTTRFGSS